MQNPFARYHYGYGRLQEGTTNRIGIEEDSTPSYYGRCRLCDFKTLRHRYEEDAQDDLKKHCQTSFHLEKLSIAAARTFEETVTA